MTVSPDPSSVPPNAREVSARPFEGARATPPPHQDTPGRFVADALAHRFHATGRGQGWLGALLCVASAVLVIGTAVLAVGALDGRNGEAPVAIDVPSGATGLAPAGDEWRQPAAIAPMPADSPSEKSSSVRGNSTATEGDN